MVIQYRYQSVVSTGGEEIELPAPGVTCVVGGNNVGKSQFLRELKLLAFEHDQSGHRVISGARASMPTGTETDSQLWLEERAVKYDIEPGGADRYSLRVGEHPLSRENFDLWVNREDLNPYLGNIAPFFVEHAAAGTLGGYAAGYVRSEGNATNYALMKLRGSGELEEELSDVIEEAFGVGVVLDRLDVQTRLRIGEVGIEVPPLNRPSNEYARALAKLPTLDSQGDGLRSFVGIASQVLTHRFDVVLIDEPEAFLHPGQARILGRWLAEQAMSRNMQVVVATHDKDFVIGLIDAGMQSSISLVRLTRTDVLTHFTQLSPEEISGIWSDPVLRYSNALQGLFHSKVVVCEADADCRFYGAALDRFAIATGRRAIADDTLLVPSSGKAGMPSALRAVSRMGVESWALPDFDVLRVRADIERIVIAMGSTWSGPIRDLYLRFVAEINQRALWEQVKHAGIDAVPPGDSYEAGKLLLEELASLRILVVPIGEMESFDKTINLHSSEWVSEALTRRVHESQVVRDFISRILMSR